MNYRVKIKFLRLVTLISLSNLLSLMPQKMYIHVHYLKYKHSNKYEELIEPANIMLLLKVTSQLRGTADSEEQLSKKQPQNPRCERVLHVPSFAGGVVLNSCVNRLGTSSIFSKFRYHLKPICVPRNSIKTPPFRTFESCEILLQWRLLHTYMPH